MVISERPRNTVFTGERTEIKQNHERKLADIQEFSAIKNEQVQTALNLLDSNSIKGLSFEQKGVLFVYFAWEHLSEKEGKELDILPKQAISRAIEIVLGDDMLVVRADRLSGLTAMIGRIQKKGIRNNPILEEFDYWVFQKWPEMKDSLIPLTFFIPKEFELNNLTFYEKKRKIYTSVAKLKRYREIKQSFKKKRESERLKAIISEVSKRPNARMEDLAGFFNVGKGTIEDDFTKLRKAKVLPERRRKVDMRTKNRLISRILDIIKNLENEGRKYEEGEIGPAEISRILNEEYSFITTFMRIHRVELGLPKRENPIRARTYRKGEVMRVIQEMVRENLDITPKEIHDHLSASHPDYKYKVGTIRAYLAKTKKNL